MKKVNNSKSNPLVAEPSIQARAEFDALAQIFQRQQRADLLTHVSKVDKANKLLKQEIARANEKIGTLQAEIDSRTREQPSELDKQVKNLLELQLKQAQEEIREQFGVNKKLQAELAIKNKNGRAEETHSSKLSGQVEQYVQENKKIYAAPCGSPENISGYVRLILQKGTKVGALVYAEQKNGDEGIIVSSDGKICEKSNSLTPQVVKYFELLLSEASAQIVGGQDEYSGEAFGEELRKLAVILTERKKWPFVRDLVIKHKNQIPGYQCIWFEAGEVVTAYESLKNFNFRLSIAAVNEQGESIHPRLEFPAPVAGWASLKSWYMESEDGYGPKLELRFETGGGHLDINVWDKMHADDQYTIAMLLESIYHHLSRTNEQWSSDFWSAAKWCDAIQRMIAILKSRRSVKFWTT